MMLVRQLLLVFFFFLLFASRFERVEQRRVETSGEKKHFLLSKTDNSVAVEGGEEEGRR